MVKPKDTRAAGLRQAAIKLRVAAKKFWDRGGEWPTDDYDRAGHARWRSLSKAAIAYADAERQSRRLERER